MKRTDAVRVGAASLLLAAGYLSLDRYAYHASDRMSNGYHPLAFFGGLLELGAALWLFFLAAGRYRSWCRRRSSRQRAILLSSGLVATTALMVWTGIALHQYKAQMPASNGSLFRFYVTPMPLWLCTASLLATLITLRPGGRSDRC